MNVVAYRVSRAKALRNYLNIEITLQNFSENVLNFKLSKWRPGRYEMANYPKNVLEISALDEHGYIIEIDKKEKNTWQIFTNGCQRITLHYTYYAYQLDAGACWVDEQLMYFNPVNCLGYFEGYEHFPCTLALNLDSNYLVATGLSPLGNHIFEAQDFDELADCPVLASPNLKHLSYEAGEKPFHLWFYGLDTMPSEKILLDFKRFTEVQLEVMGGMPCNEFHFMFIIPPYRHYHGVEHRNSTVCVVGPSKDFELPNIYNDFLGVSSHELFHLWNVKHIRPEEMLPYDFETENYSKLGYVYEGFTTYYGDLFLSRSLVFSELEFHNEINTFFQRHFSNYGRFYRSLAESSFDTWVDGYVPGTPNRKVSIYAEGALNALILDLRIREITQNEKSLDSLMRGLYQLANKGNGYSEAFILEWLFNNTGVDFSNHFQEHYHKPISLELSLSNALSFVGCGLDLNQDLSWDQLFGFELKNLAGNVFVSSIAPNSPASKNGLGVDDLILEVNGELVSSLDIVTLMNIETAHLELLVKDAWDMPRLIILDASSERFYPKYTLHKMESATDEQKANYTLWCGQTW